MKTEIEHLRDMLSAIAPAMERLHEDCTVPNFYNSAFGPIEVPPIQWLTDGTMATADAWTEQAWAAGVAHQEVRMKENDLLVLIGKAEALAKIAGTNGDFCLTKQEGDFSWIAEIGNPNPFVSIGETGGDFTGRGKTPAEAINDMIKRIA